MTANAMPSRGALRALPPARTIEIWNALAEGGYTFTETLVRFADAVIQEASRSVVSEGNAGVRPNSSAGLPGERPLPPETTEAANG